MPLAVRIVGRAVLAGLVVRTGAVHFAVVLRDVEVDRPRAQLVRELLQRFVEFALVFPVVAFG